jgi:hypothetical protein
MNPHYSSIVESAGCLVDDIAFWQKQYDDQNLELLLTRTKILNLEMEIASLQAQLHNHLIESKNRDLPIPYRR